eukprot:scaffold561876_cov32-Prasinocladus_malaysianus.AAC.1
MNGFMPSRVASGVPTADHGAQEDDEEGEDAASDAGGVFGVEEGHHSAVQHDGHRVVQDALAKHHAAMGTARREGLRSKGNAASVAAKHTLPNEFVCKLQKSLSVHITEYVFVTIHKLLHGCR